MNLGAIICIAFDVVARGHSGTADRNTWRTRGRLVDRIATDG